MYDQDVQVDSFDVMIHCSLMATASAQAPLFLFFFSNAIVRRTSWLKVCSFKLEDAEDGLTHLPVKLHCHR